MIKKRMKWNGELVDMYFKNEKAIAMTVQREKESKLWYHKIKQRARSKAVRKISTKGKKCEICGSLEGISRHHHDGYDKPLKVHFLCKINFYNGMPIIEKNSCHYHANRLMNVPWKEAKKIIIESR